MTAYRIASGRVTTTARSSVHDTRTVWARLSGSVDADAAALERATLALEVDMASFDAGDFLKNRKLKKDLDVARHPTARFTLRALEDVRPRGDGFAARARGVLAWRGREVEVVAEGEGRLGADGFRATARFELDVTRVGVTPPRFLMFKVEDVVSVEVELSGRPA
jgi:polyisoprenoid-binding protein YceI